MLILIQLIMGWLGLAPKAFAEGESGAVFIEGDFINQDIFKLSVHTRDVKNTVIGVAFDLRFEQGKVLFLKYEPGDFLEVGGDPIYLVKSDLVNGRIVFGETLTREDKFPSGDGKVADFYFQVKDGVDYEEVQGNLSFRFERGTVSTFNEIRQDLDQIVWKDLSTKKLEVTSKVAGEIDKEVEVENLVASESGSEDYLVGIVIGMLIFLILLCGLKMARKRAL